MRGNKRRTGLWLLMALGATSASAAPLDLTDARPRWIAVEFEVSPADRPAQLRRRFTPRLPARLEPGSRPGELRVHLAGQLVERFLLPGASPAPGSFGAFTWTFDAATGHVRSAEVAGVVEEEVRFGFGSWSTETEIQVRMNTRTPVSFESVAMLGRPVHRLCKAARAPRCTVVEPKRLDPRTGYVNAVGSIVARSRGLSVKSFSPLGEAVFTEIDTPLDPIWSSALETWELPGVAARPEARR